MIHLKFSAIGDGLSLKLKIFKQQLLEFKIKGIQRCLYNSEKDANKIHHDYLGIFNRHALNPDSETHTHSINISS